MGEKIKRLIRNGRNDELLKRFCAKRYRTRLNEEYEMLLIERCSPKVVLAYINHFFLSDKGEKCLVEKMPVEVCMWYYKLYCFSDATQLHIIDNNLVDVARAWFQNSDFCDVQYMLGCQNDDIILAYIESHKLENDEEVLYLLDHRNKNLLVSYIKKGWALSNEVKEKIIERDNLYAFRALAEHYNHIYRIRLNNTSNFRVIMGQIEDYALTPDLQIKVLKDGNPMFVDVMLSLMPLSVEAQEYMVENNMSTSLFKKHVEGMYCLGGYRFEKEFEPSLFRAIAKNNLDECLTSYKYHDQLTVVNYASVEAVLRYVKSVWLSDIAQVALIYRGDEAPIREFISRCSWDRGLCWEAEVALAHLNNDKLLEQYINIHTMCEEAVKILSAKNIALHHKYCARYAK